MNKRENEKAFEAFWERYPRKVSKLAAKRAWLKAGVTSELNQKIHAALDWQIPVWSRTEVTFIPHPATWLNGGRWDDEPPASVKAKPPARPAFDPSKFSEEQLAALARIKARQRLLP